jgi:hypothetical protein
LVLAALISSPGFLPVERWMVAETRDQLTLFADS